MVTMKPGDTITPGGGTSQVPEGGPITDEKMDQVDETEQTQTGWQYKADEGSSNDAPQTSGTNGQAVSWTASEFIAHEKSVGWYMLLALVSVGLTALVYLFTKDKFASVMILFVALMFGVVAARKPRVLEYEIGDGGVRIGEKLYPYQVLKSFSVIQVGAVSSVLLIPLRRFMPALTMYYPPDQEDAVLDALGNYLPKEERRSDPIDRLMHKVRF